MVQAQGCPKQQGSPHRRAALRPRPPPWQPQQAGTPGLPAMNPAALRAVLQAGRMASRPKQAKQASRRQRRRGSRAAVGYGLK
jgi:hypothetical protein